MRIQGNGANHRIINVRVEVNSFGILFYGTALGWIRVFAVPPFKNDASDALTTKGICGAAMVISVLLTCMLLFGCTSLDSLDFRRKRRWTP